MTNKYDFSGKIAWVTGAASGLGKATAVLLAANGATVLITDLDMASINEVVSEITQAGGKAIGKVCNVIKEDEVEETAKFIQKEFGKLDMAVNNAGIGGKWLPTHKYPTDNFRQVMEVNTMGVFFGMRAQINIMLNSGGGSIVNVSSLSGLLGFPNNIAYATSKHAVIGLTKTAGLEYANKGVRVNAVCPVFVKTPLVESIFELDASLEQKLEYTIPMKRYGKPEEVADVIAWLCSDASSFVTATAIPIDGGTVAG